MDHAVRRRVAAVMGMLFALAACGGPDGSPESRIRALIADAEAAAEARDLDVFKEIISRTYRDERGYDRRTALRIIQGNFLRNRRIHLFTIVRNLNVEEGAARARVVVAMGGQPIESAEALLSVRADLMRFDVELALEGSHWRVRRAAWARAALADFL